MNKKRMFTLAFIIYLAFLASTYAAQTIWSNTVTVSPHQYALGTLSVDNPNPNLNATVTFTGTLLYDGQGIQNIWVILYNSTDQTAWTECGQGKTNSTGYYTVPYQVTQNNTMYFKAGYTTP